MVLQTKPVFAISDQLILFLTNHVICNWFFADTLNVFYHNFCNCITFLSQRSSQLITCESNLFKQLNSSSVRFIYIN